MIGGTRLGYAILCPQARSCEEKLVGKALESLKKDKGLILVLLMR